VTSLWLILAAFALPALRGDSDCFGRMPGEGKQSGKRPQRRQGSPSMASLWLILAALAHHARRGDSDYFGRMPDCWPR